MFRIARRVAKDRVISTVDADTRHGHKTAARGLRRLQGTCRHRPRLGDHHRHHGDCGQRRRRQRRRGPDHRPARRLHRRLDTENIAVEGDSTEDVGDPGEGSTADRASVYGDNAYGTGELHARLERAGIESKCKTQQPVAKGGRFAKDRFQVDLQRDTVRCPAGRTAPIRRSSNGAGAANFWPYCTHCPLRQQCTTAPDGRTITVGIHERQLAACAGPTTRPGLDHRLPGHPTQGRTQDRPPDAPPPRRTPRPGPGHHQDRRRLRPARRRRQPRPPRSAGRGQRPRTRMGHRDPMSRTGR